MPDLHDPGEELAFGAGEFEVVELTEEDERILRAAEVDVALALDECVIDDGPDDDDDSGNAGDDDDLYMRFPDAVDRAHYLITRAHQSARGGTFLDLHSEFIEVIGEISLPILASYERIDLSDNSLSDLPKGFGGCKALRWLDLSANSFSGIPEEIGSLDDLEYLKFSDNAVRSLPGNLSSLRNLTYLNVSNCHLGRVAPSIGRLTSLKSLILSTNAIKGLPEEIVNCQKLEALSVSSNRLGSVPAVIFKLSSLTELDLSQNGIKALPNKMERIKSLRKLYLNLNSLAELPASIGELDRLEEMDVSENSLSSLPGAIGELHNLRRLDLSINALTDLPAELSKLRRDISLGLDHNDFSDTFSSLIEQGLPAVFSYLESLENSAPQYEAKLILVGEGGVGKSTLIAALRGEAFVENRATTHGIELGQLNVPHPALPTEITLNSWDFGGQDVYRITHQFFFSRRALYLLCWKPREGQEQNSIEEWCRRIRLRTGSDAKIIVVATHADERRPELDFGYLRMKYPEILVDYFVIDSESGRGIVDLRNAIAKHSSSLPQMGELRSNSWIAASERVTSISKPHISRLAFERVCAEEGLDEESVQALANLLHDLGHIIHYADDEGLRELVVLQPEWLTKAIGYVLEDEQTRVLGGVLQHASLQDIWSEPAIAGAEGYPEKLHPYFLRLMEKFDITYRLPDEPASLVAQLVPYERPSPLEWDAISIDSETKKLRLVCRTADEAPGLIAWLTVRYHQFSVGRHWRRGVLLVHEPYASQAVIELAPNNVDLILTVLGPAPEYLFHYLRDGIEELINRRWKALRYHFLIPCGKPVPPGAKTCTGYFTYQSLVRFRQRGEEHIICQSCVEWSDVSVLLTGFGRQSGRIDDLLVELARSQQSTDARLQRIEAHAANTARVLRVALRVLSSEVSDTPRLFTLIPEDKSQAIRTVSPRRYFLLTLWCEEPGAEHKVGEATYRLRLPKEWVQVAAPYVRLVVKVLQFVVPVATAAYGAYLSPDELASAKQDLELTKTLADKLPMPEDGQIAAIDERRDRLTRAEGSGLRALRQLLMQLDPAARYGGLRRVHSSSGDLLWVCPEHHKHYDPGLPELSYAESIEPEELA